MGDWASQCDVRGATGDDKGSPLWRLLGFLHCCCSRGYPGIKCQLPGGPQRFRESCIWEHRFQQREGLGAGCWGQGQASWWGLGEAGDFLGLHTCFFWPHLAACGILVPQPEIEPRTLAVKVPSPNHWTAREFPGPSHFDLGCRWAGRVGKGCWGHLEVLFAQECIK